MRSVLITGGSGSFGQAFTKRLLEVGTGRICILSRCEVRQAEMAAAFRGERRLRFFIGDVRDKERLRRAMEDVEVVVHAAALKRIEVGHYNPAEMVKTNVNGAMNVIEAAHDAGVKKIVALSTDKAYRPVSPYGHSKALAEAIFLASNETRGHKGPRCSVVRYGNVWNSRGSVVPRWQGLLAIGQPISITDPECTRFYMRMEQAIDLVLRAIAEMPAEVLIPELPAYRLGDIPVAMGVGPRRIRITGLPPYEKQHESMSDEQCSQTARRMTIEELRAALNGSNTSSITASPNMKQMAG